MKKWHWSPLLFQGKGKALVWSLNIKELTFLNPIHCQGQQVTLFEKCWSSSKQHLHHHKSQIKINPAPTPSKSIYASVSVPPGPIWKFLNFVATTTKKCELSMTSWQFFTRFISWKPSSFLLLLLLPSARRCHDALPCFDICFILPCSSLSRLTLFRFPFHTLAGFKHYAEFFDACYNHSCVIMYMFGTPCNFDVASSDDF